MGYSLERLVRTSSSEKYRLFHDREAYAEINIHYANVINVDVVLLTEEAEDVDDEIIENLDNIITSEVIMSYSSYIEEIQYNIYVGGRVAISTSRPNEIPSESEAGIEYM